MDAAGAQPRLANCETLTLTLEKVARRHVYVVELDLGVTLTIVVAEDSQASHDPHPGSIDRDDDHRLLSVRRRCWVCLSHHDQQSTVDMQRIGGKPFAPVEQITV